MYKFRDGKEEEFFCKENINRLIKLFNGFNHYVKRPFSISTNQRRDGYDITERDFNQFKSKHDSIKENVMFSEYFIGLKYDYRIDSFEMDDFDARRFDEQGCQMPQMFILEIGNIKIVTDELDKFFEKKDEMDLSNLDLAQLQNKILLAQGQTPLSENSLDVKLTGKTFSKSVEKKSELEDMRQEYFQTKKAIEDEQHEALEKLRVERERIQSEIAKKQEFLMAEMRIKELELKAKMRELNKEVKILDLQMYDLKSYFGESYDLIQIRKGKSAPLDQPLTINQKVRFLNEDLGVLIGLYGDELSKERHKNLIEAFKHSDKLVDYFCQTDKSVTFFRLSRSHAVVDDIVSGRENHNDRGTEASFYLKAIVNERGHDFVGFVIKDGDNLHFGVLKEGQRIIVKEDIFHDIKAPDREVDFSKMSKHDYKRFQKEQAEERVARKFIFSILQGLIDNQKIIQFEDIVNIFSAPSEIIFSSASGRIGTSLYGDFSSLKEKLNKMSRVDDDIYMLERVNDTNRLEKYFKYKPNITPPKGIVKVSRVDIDNGVKDCYVTARREKVQYYDDGSDVNCKLRLEMNEFVNIQYFNTKWIEYFIANKETDSTSYGNKEFHVMVKHLMSMRDYLLKREIIEKDAIEKHYPELDKLDNWQVVLSEWKLQQKNPVRIISDYQAKRFAKALTSSSIKPMKFLYQEKFEELTKYHHVYLPKERFENDVSNIISFVNKIVKKSALRYNQICERTDKEKRKDIVFNMISLQEYLDEETKNKIANLNLRNGSDEERTKHVEPVTFKDNIGLNSKLISMDMAKDLFEKAMAISQSKIDDDLKEPDTTDLEIFFDKYTSDKRKIINIDDYADEFIKEEEELLKLFSGEVAKLDKVFNYDVISNKDNLSKTIKKIIVILDKNYDTATDEVHRELINTIYKAQDELSYSSGFNTIQYARIERYSMSPKNDIERALILKDRPEALHMELACKPGYYNYYDVYDKSKLRDVYRHTFLRLIGEKYTNAVSEINNYPLYRIK